MIVTFILVFSYILDLLKAKLNTRDNFPVSEEINNEKVVEHNSIKEFDIKSLNFGGFSYFENGDLRFYPAAYIQRHDAVANIIDLYKLKGSIKKVVDLGCGELSSFGYFKHADEVEEYIGVDIDRNLLQKSFTTVTPLVSDYISRKCVPFKVSILNGNVVEPDIRLKDANVTIAVEVIEHMYPDDLDKLPYNIFGIVQPEIAIFTTPNSDFNEIFPNFTGFRHPDHKFEWSRSQFEDWANNLIVRYPDYEVSIHGIARGPEGSEHLGCCTQMAIFLRKTQEIHDKSHEFREIYDCIHEVEYPFITPEEKFNNILEYEVYQAIRYYTQCEEYHVRDQVEVPLDVFMKKIQVEPSIEQLLKFLKKENCDIKHLNDKGILIIPFLAGSSEASLSDYDINDFNNLDNVSYVGEEEIWDTDENNENRDEWKDLTNENAIGWESENDKAGINISEINISSIFNNSEICNETVLESNEDHLHDANVSNGLISEPLQFESSSAKSMSDITQTMEQEHTKCSTGAIPKRKNNSSENLGTSSTGSSSLVESVVKRDLSLVNTSEDHLEDSNVTAKSNEPYLDSSILRPVRTDSEKVHNSFSESSSSHVTVNNSTIKQCSQNSEDCVSLKNPPEDDRNEGAYSSLPLEVGYDQASSFVQRCHSLENVNVNNCKNKNFRYSLNIDNDHIDCDTSVVEMELEVCHKVSSIPSLSDTFGSHSKAPDSGYPNSVHDMELDLTPEQVDEIITESESSLEDEESSAEERVEEVVQGNNAPVVFLDEVENGDVANNNRDGEGNNMEGGEVVIEEAMGFEGLAMDGGDVEAGQHESDDEGLYLSALDMSNETIVPEECSSQDPEAFNSLFDLPSSSSLLRLSEIDHEPPSPPPRPVEPPLLFPPWLLDILVNDVCAAGGDAGGDRDEADGSISTLSSESFLVDTGNDHVEMTVQGDTMGGGEPSTN